MTLRPNTNAISSNILISSSLLNDNLTDNKHLLLNNITGNLHRSGDMSSVSAEEVMDLISQYNPATLASEHIHESRRLMLNDDHPVPDEPGTTLPAQPAPTQSNSIPLGPLRHTFRDAYDLRSRSHVDTHMQDAAPTMTTHRAADLKESAQHTLSGPSMTTHQSEIQTLRFKLKKQVDQIHALEAKLKKQAGTAKGPNVDQLHLHTRLKNLESKLKNQIGHIHGLEAKIGRQAKVESQLIAAEQEASRRLRSEQQRNKDIDEASRTKITALESKLAEVTQASKLAQKSMGGRIDLLEKTHNQDVARIKMLLAIKADNKQELALAKETIANLQFIAGGQSLNATLCNQALLLQSTTLRIQQLEQQLGVTSTVGEWTAGLPQSRAIEPPQADSGDSGVGQPLEQAHNRVVCVDNIGAVREETNNHAVADPRLRGDSAVGASENDTWPSRHYELFSRYCEPSAARDSEMDTESNHDGHEKAPAHIRADSVVM